ncbi:hypothetical protein EDD11_008355 [Mortierella claussenii]|nr:hypothetical protein EDD11_008355 [Mortierella claussenii]
MVTVPVCIFDIPLIVASICDHLAPHDIWHCYRVNKQFNLLFGPYRFRDVLVFNPTLAQQSLILENAYNIRHLTVDLVDAQLLTSSIPSTTTTSTPYSSCTQLKQLSCLNLGALRWPPQDDEIARRQWFQSYHPLWVRIDPSLNALSLIAQNPGLESLRIDHRIDRVHPQPFTTDVIKALSRHVSLRQVSISMKMDIRAMIAVLTHCPPFLQDLEIRLDVCNKAVEQEPGQDQLEPMQLSGPTRLRRLILHGALFEFENIILVPLLKQCPDLEILKLPQLEQVAYKDVLQTVVKHCPNLHTFRHKLGYGVGVQSLLWLFRGLTRGLREVEIDCVGDYRGEWSSLGLVGERMVEEEEEEEEEEGALARALLSYSSHTLEVLRLRGQIGLSVEGLVVALMQQCPNLEQLEVSGDSFSLSDLVHNAPFVEGHKHYYTTKNVISSDHYHRQDRTSHHHHHQRPWICIKLESLSLQIHESVLYPFSTTIHFMEVPHQQQDVLQQIERIHQNACTNVSVLCQRLRALKHLQQLTVIWDKTLLQVLRTKLLAPLMDQGERRSRQEMTQEDMQWMGVCSMDTQQQQQFHAHVH